MTALIVIVSVIAAILFVRLGIWILLYDDKPCIKIGVQGLYFELKLGKGKPAMPFADARLLNALSHTLWFLPSVAACEAMGNLLRQRQNKFYHDYKINVCAGNKA